MLKLLMFSIFMVAFAHAEINDLELLIKDLEQKPIHMEPLVLPQLQIIFENYKSVEQNNIFDSGRSSSYDMNTYSYNQDYNLNQLQMVGYMNYTGISYAFLKTPFETIKVKVGDQIKGGKVMSITANAVEINQLQVVDNKNYVKKIFIELVQPDNNKPKLTIK